MREAKTFLDTNIIIYAYDSSAGEKHETAKDILVDLWNSDQGLLSTQVLQEFFVSVTKKIKRPLDIKIAKEIVDDLLKWDVVVNDGKAILGAIDIQLRYRYSFWDSMIIQAAQTGGALLLLSEDLSDNQTIDGVEIKNPFA
ncbi:MAG: PIN domain-containing protein [Actinobacteria bacterium]|nr:PIN domain-containing protein [Actinomycetota bacterium]